jgi:hypothetical protein
MRKTYFDIVAPILAAAFLLAGGGAFAQGYPRPQIQQPQTPPVQYQPVPPRINSVYAAPMRRTGEIPLYGRNKSMYFYNQPKNEDGVFSGAGLYAFAAFGTGTTSEGMNLEQDILVNIGSDANDTMGDATSFTIGVGRIMSSKLSAELFYSSFTGMSYGKFSREHGEIDTETYDEEENPIYEPTIFENYEVISGGGISSTFFGLGFQYRLDNTFGAVLGGMFKPYVGFQIGIAKNDVADYTFSDFVRGSEGDVMYGAEVDNAWDENAPNPDFIEDGAGPDTAHEQIDFDYGEVTYIGQTTSGFGYGLEAGLTMTLEGNLELDFYFKRSMLGKVKTSGTRLETYDEYYTDFYDNVEGCDENAKFYDDGNTFCVMDAGYATTHTVTPRVSESGNVVVNQYGVKIKYLF